MTPGRRNGPAGNGTVSQSSVAAASVVPTVAQTSSQWDPDALNERAAMTRLPGYWAGYMSGLMAGIPIGREQLEDEIRRAWLPVARYVRGLGVPTSRTYAELVAIREANFRTAQPVPTVAECEASWQPLLQRRAA
ncbi:hypothetical protein GCM10028777_24990 [Angustibacter speluncae]